MLQNTDMIRVENRDDSLVGYIIPETKTLRRFNAFETKEISMGELRQMVNHRGCRNILINHLILHSKEAVDELIPEVEPEYFYTIKDVDFLLERGTYDQLLDALDFAPEGVINLIKEQAVNIELNDMRKREAILEKTHFDVTSAINIKRLSKVAEKTEVKTRRSTPIGETPVEETVSEEPVRRSVAPKYRIATKDE